MSLPNRQTPSWRLAPSGDSCLVVVIDAPDVEQANKFACEVAAGLIKADLRGVSDVVPSMTAVGIHYDPAAIQTTPEAPVPYEALAMQVQCLMAGELGHAPASGREVIIPVCYGDEFGPDLGDVARACGLSAEDVVALHTGQPVSVFMLGFAPGHPYLGTFDQRLALPRRSTPRTAVPQGSIGLANRQTVIYPMVLPGGWNLIGRTPLTLFDPYRSTPCLLNAGDQVRFRAISSAEFQKLQAQQEVVNER